MGLENPLPEVHMYDSKDWLQLTWAAKGLSFCYRFEEPK